MPEPVPMQPAHPADASRSAPEQAPVSFRASIETAIGRLLVLRVTTVVGEVSATAADRFDQVTGLALAPTGQLVACTSFNLLLGDGSVIMSPEFVANPDMRALHADAVAQAHAMRANSMALLEAAWDKFGGLLEREAVAQIG